MKKLLIFISMLVLLCSCDPESLLNPPYIGIWYVQNNSTQNLYIRASTINFKSDSISIDAGDSAILANGRAPYEDQLYFDLIAHTRLPNDNTYVEFYSDPEFKSLIKGWYESEADNPTGHKFLFSESSWTARSWQQDLNGRKNYYTYHTWTYTVTDDDLKAWEAGQ
ncbi:MAG: hypothetical protein LKK19_02470 [Bacteroidales bacterium]|jgi:hypothetical protein|nr:hypothetical protein [Bacteroidales bacterium]MCI2121550.1 hypothetical protein [Bacteroidales bacterium]MCI2145419.1 hypothetical protein [Bacteroidales bacterium]